MTIASNDDFTKQIAPVVAPHMVNIDLLLNQLHRLESAVVGTSQQQPRATNGSGMRVEESVSLLQGLFQQGMKMMMAVGKENNNDGDKTSHLHNNNSSSNSNSGGSHTNHYDPRVEELPLDASDESVYSTAAAASASMDTSTSGLRFRQKPSDDAR